MRIDLKLLIGLEGETTLAETFGLNSTVLSAQITEARQLLTSGLVVPARERLEALVALSPRESEIWGLLEVIYEALGDASDAAQAKQLSKTMKSMKR